MVIKNNLSIFFENIYNIYNHSYIRIKNNNKYFNISNQFQIIYNINTASDIQNKTNNKSNVNNIIKNNYLVINYYLIIIMIIIIFDLLLISIKRILNEQKIIKDKIKIKKQSNDSNINIIISNINFIVVFIIKLLIILNLVNQIKCKDIILKDSKIFLKVKGIGENTIFGNITDRNFKGINHLRYVYINEKQENSIEYTYYFNQTDNLVELIFDYDLDDCAYMF